jgi:hypothetical protein
MPGLESEPWRLRIFPVLLLLLVPHWASAQQDVAEAGWVSLFNGEDLDGWIPKIRRFPPGENFADTFRVEDGLLTVAYDGYDEFDDRFGHLFYAAPFSHYRLRFEYRFVGEQVAGGPEWALRNSGAMLHSQPPDTMPDEQDFPVSLEVQLLGGFGDGRPRSTANLCTPGTNVVYESQFTTAHCIDSSSPTYDGERWVAVDILVLGSDSIAHSVDGEVVIEYSGMETGGGAVSGHRPEMQPEGRPLGAGFIALQSESHPVQFRRIELLNLEGCLDPESPAHRPWFAAAAPSACD